jgi:hypothetical protein
MDATTDLNKQPKYLFIIPYCNINLSYVTNITKES